MRTKKLIQGTDCATETPHIYNIIKEKYMFQKLSRFIGLVAIIITFAFQACTPKQIASDLTSQIMRGGAPAIEMEPDVEIAERSGMTLIKMMEALQYDNPKNKNYHILLARSYGNYTLGFIELKMLKYEGKDEQLYQKNLKRAKRFYATGKQMGLAVLKKNGSFKKALTKDLDSFKKALKGFGRGSVPQLFWTAFNWGSTINLNKDSPLAIIEFPKVEAIMKRVLELDEYFFYGGPHLFMAVSYGSRPKMFGGDPIKSKEHFEKAIKAYNRKFLMAIVLYAQFYAVQMQDKDLFRQLLNEVIEADAAALPEQRLANELAKKRAKVLLNRIDDYF